MIFQINKEVRGFIPRTNFGPAARSSGRIKNLSDITTSEKNHRNLDGGGIND